MTQKIINVGLTQDDGSGDNLRSAGLKINDNFTELYTVINNSQNYITEIVGGQNISVTSANGIITIDNTFVQSPAVASALTGNTLAPNVVRSSLTSTGILTSLQVSGTASLSNISFANNGQIIDFSGQTIMVNTSGTIIGSGEYKATIAARSSGAVELVANDGSDGDSSGNTWTFSTDGRLTTPGQVNIISTDTADSGPGYAGIFKLTNNNVGATLINKSIRISDTGHLQIVNSTYQNTIFDLSDSGNLTIAGILKLPVLTAEPTSPVTGMMAIADGNVWDPSLDGIECLVVYLNGAWVTIT
jgi:hypothetical protein